MDALIEVEKLSKTYTLDSGKKITAVTDIGLGVQEGEFLILLGPSGCGKSTLLRILSGLDTEFEGKLSYKEDLKFTDFSFVFQQFALLPWLTVYENVELGLVGRKIPQSVRKSAVTGELVRFGLERFSGSYPRELSGGMKQRVGIARALATKPKVIFMDEPFSELDSFTAQELRQDVLKIWEEDKPTIVMVTHLIQEAIELGDRIAVMTTRPGTIEKIVENDLPRPRKKRSEAFFELEDKLGRIIKP